METIDLKPFEEAGFAEYHSENPNASPTLNPVVHAWLVDNPSEVGHPEFSEVYRAFGKGWNRAADEVFEAWVEENA